MRLQSFHSCGPGLSVEGGHNWVGDVVRVRLLASTHAGHQGRGECPLHLQQRQDLSCTYLARHELESINTGCIIIFIFIIAIITEDCM